LTKENGICIIHTYKERVSKMTFIKGKFNKDIYWYRREFKGGVVSGHFKICKNGAYFWEQQKVKHNPPLTGYCYRVFPKRRMKFREACRLMISLEQLGFKEV